MFVSHTRNDEDDVEDEDEVPEEERKEDDFIEEEIVLVPDRKEEEEEKVVLEEDVEEGGGPMQQQRQQREQGRTTLSTSWVNGTTGGRRSQNDDNTDDDDDRLDETVWDIINEKTRIMMKGEEELVQRLDMQTSTARADIADAAAAPKLDTTPSNIQESRVHDTVDRVRLDHSNSNNMMPNEKKPTIMRKNHLEMSMMKDELEKRTPMEHPFLSTMTATMPGAVHVDGLGVRTRRHRIGSSISSSNSSGSGTTAHSVNEIFMDMAKEKEQMSRMMMTSTATTTTTTTRKSNLEVQKIPNEHEDKEEVLDGDSATPAGQPAEDYVMQEQQEHPSVQRQSRHTIDSVTIPDDNQEEPIVAAAARINAADGEDRLGTNGNLDNDSNVENTTTTNTMQQRGGRRSAAMRRSLLRRPGAHSIRGIDYEVGDSLIVDNINDWESVAIVNHHTPSNNEQHQHPQEELYSSLDFSNVQAYVDELIPQENVQSLAISSNNNTAIAEEQEPTSSSSSSRQRKIVLVLLLTFILCGISGFLAVYLLLSSSTSDNDAPLSTTISSDRQPLTPIPASQTSSIPSMIPTKSPTQSPTTSKFAILLDLLEDKMSIDRSKLLEDSSSYQYRALDWLANHDLYPLSFGTSSEATTEMSLQDEEYLVTRYVLATIYIAGSGHHGWLDNASYCTWFGITCKENNVTVTAIVNGFYKYVGFLPTEIGLLTSLQTLDLSWNDFVGVLPTEIGLLTSLEVLNLERGGFTGTVPSEIGRLSSLTVLYLDRTGLTGTLPTEIGKMTSMQILEIDRSGFTGTIPTEIGNLHSIKSLELDVNGFNGTLPTEIFYMTNLTVFNLDHNALTGSLPSGIGQLTLLTDLNLGNNTFTGMLPTEIGLIVSRPRHWSTHLSLNDNWFTGTLPTQLGLLTSLSYLDLKNNAFTGTLPTEIGQMTSLDHFDLNDNGFTGMIPTEIGLLTLLEGFHLAQNPFSGMLPTEIGQLNALEELLLYGTDLIGNITTVFCVEANNIQTYNYYKFPNLEVISVNNQIVCDCCRQC